MFQCKIKIGKCLCFYALRGVNDEQRSFTGSQRPTHLIGEIDVTGSIDQIQRIHLTITSMVLQSYCPQLDSDATLTLNIHGIKDLFRHLALRYGVSAFQEPISQRGFSMVNMSNNTEVPYAVLQTWPPLALLLPSRHSTLKYSIDICP